MNTQHFQNALMAMFGGCDGQHPVFLRAAWKDAVAQDKTIYSYWDWVAHVSGAAEQGCVSDPRQRLLPDGPVVEYFRALAFFPCTPHPGIVTFRLRLSDTEFLSIMYDGPHDLVGTDLNEQTYIVGRFSEEQEGFYQTACGFDVPSAIAVAYRLATFPPIKSDDQLDFPNLAALDTALAQLPTFAHETSKQYEYTHPYFAPSPVVLDWFGCATSLAQHLVDGWVPHGSFSERQTVFRYLKVARC